MTRYAFTGPSKLSPSETKHAAAVVTALDEPTEITTGAAAGWDMAIAEAAIEVWPLVHHRVVCPGAPYDRIGLDRLIRRAGELRLERFTVVNLPADLTAAGSYRVRNVVLLDYADVLSAAVRNLDYYRSGEWMTVNLAKKRGRPIQWIDLREVGSHE